MVIRLLHIALSIGCLLYNAAAWSTPEVTAQGLFRDKALLVIDGHSRLLKVGETSPEGVKLVSSNSKKAVIRLGGRNITLEVSQRIATSFKAAKLPEVKLTRQNNGHFFADGAINGRPATFMIDTGASAIAINTADAARLDINTEDARTSVASTAGGIVNTRVVKLDKVRVGTITLYDIAAHVVEGDYPEHILLGNSFLSRVEMNERGGIMTLKKKFQ